MQVVIVDGSGGHTAKKLPVPPNVVLHRPPSCTPELRPAEHLWPLVREGVANRVFEGLPTLTDTLVKQCGWLADHPEVIGGTRARGSPSRSARGWLVDHPEVIGGAVGFHWAVAA